MSTALPPLDNTMGALLIGTILGAVLYGVTCVQTWFYFRNYSKDNWWIKSVVIFIWVFDTTHQALISHVVYDYLVTHYAQPAYLGVLVWSVIVEVLFNALTALCVQCFLAMRIWKLSNGNLFFAGMVGSLVAAEFLCCVVFTIKGLGFSTWAELGTIKDLSMAVNALAVAADGLIAILLCTMLQKSRSGFKASDTIITRLTVFAVNTGALTSVCAVASLVSVAVWGDTFIYVCFFFCLGRLYSNSLLATLNARKSIRNVMDDAEYESFSFTNVGGPRNFKASQNSNIAIQIDTTTTDFAGRSQVSKLGQNHKDSSFQGDTKHSYVEGV